MHTLEVATCLYTKGQF